MKRSVLFKAILAATFLGISSGAMAVNSAPTSIGVSATVTEVCTVGTIIPISFSPNLIITPTAVDATQGGGDVPVNCTSGAYAIGFGPGTGTIARAMSGQTDPINQLPYTLQLAGSGAEVGTTDGTFSFPGIPAYTAAAITDTGSGIEQAHALEAVILGTTIQSATADIYSDTVEVQVAW